MAEYSNDNRGSIWPAKEKKSDRHPDFEGSQNVCCPKCNQSTDYWVSGWKPKNGANPRSPSLTWTVKAKDGKAPPHRKPDMAGGRQSMDDEIPF